MLIPGTCWPSLLPKEPSKFNRRSFRASLLLALAPRKEQRPQSYASPMQMPTLVQLQPEAVVSMSLRVDPLNVEGKLRDEKGQRDWNSGLFGCCTSPHDLALSVFWWVWIEEVGKRRADEEWDEVSPCLVYGQTKDRLNDLNAGKSASDPGESLYVLIEVFSSWQRTLRIACCPGGGWVYGVLCVFTGLGCCLDWGLRRWVKVLITIVPADTNVIGTSELDTTSLEEDQVTVSVRPRSSAPSPAWCWPMERTILVATFCCVCNQVQSAREVQQELDFLHQEGPAPQSTRAERVRASVQV
jgi:hypothetical protein